MSRIDGVYCSSLIHTVIVTVVVTVIVEDLYVCMCLREVECDSNTALFGENSTTIKKFNFYVNYVDWTVCNIESDRMELTRILWM